VAVRAVVALCAVTLLASGAWGGALLHAGLHLAGSLLATAVGIASVRAFT